MINLKLIIFFYPIWFLESLDILYPLHLVVQTDKLSLKSYTNFISMIDFCFLKLKVQVNFHQIARSLSNYDLCLPIFRLQNMFYM